MTILYYNIILLSTSKHSAHWPAQLRRYEIAVRRELCRVLVHLTHQPFPTRFGRVTELLEHRVDPGQQRTVERIVIGQQVRTGRYGVEDFVILGLVLSVVVSGLELSVGHRVRTVFHRVSAEKLNDKIRVWQAGAIREKINTSRPNEPDHK